MNKPQFEKTNDPMILLANAKKAVALCKELTPGSGMLFFIPPEEDINNMSPEAKIESICMPTYTLAAYLIHCKMCLKEQFTKDKELESGFKGILLASAGIACGDNNILVDALEIFLTAPLKAFLAEYGKEYPDFTQCAQSALESLKDLAESEDASGERLQKRAEGLVSAWEKA